MKNRSTNNSGYRYKHSNSTVYAIDSQTKVIKKRDLKGSNRMPDVAEDGDKTYILLNNDNSVKQIRDYNQLTQLQEKDIDTGIEGEHAHDWVDGMRQKKRPLTPEENKRLKDLQSMDFSPNNLHYYPIDENLAKRANDANSFSDYKKNSETIAYKASVDEVFDLADKVKAKTKDPEVIKKADYLANSYAKKYANWINNKNKVDASVPSILITGAGNFPVKKKERQNAQRDKYWQEYEKINNIKTQIEDLKYYKPRNEKQGKAVTNGYNFENKHFDVIQNEEANRLQLKFNGKPDSETRNLLKHNGFKWSPKNESWQRQLTPNARYATETLIKQLDEKDKS